MEQAGMIEVRGEVFLVADLWAFLRERAIKYNCDNGYKMENIVMIQAMMYM